MKEIKNLLILIPSLFIGSCTFVYYPTYPTVADPVGKSLNVSAAIGFTKAQIGATYNIDSNLFVTTYLNGVLSTLNRDTTNSIKNTYNSFTQVLGFGYKNKISPKMEFQIQGGLGNSDGYFRTDVFCKDDNISLVDVDTRSLRAYIQPTFAVTNKHVHIYFIPKVTYEMFNKITQRKNDNYLQGIKLQNKNFLIGEAFVVGRFVAKKINIDLYSGLSFNMLDKQRSHGSDGFVVQPFTIGFGLSKTIGL
ncbi:MAG: hypothetical protein IT243_11315 [Bacteroidia bacterium]|nr:hypothetical protein [Bacteroidia bacterium]